ncbi:MAG TPA: DUF6209 family protein [Candidatus Binatia bacterium]
MAGTAILQFFPDWRQTQQGAIQRGEKLRIEYDMTRLPHCFTPWRYSRYRTLCASGFGDIRSLRRSLGLAIGIERLVDG